MKIKYITEEYLQENFQKSLIVEYPNNVKEYIPTPIVSVILITYQHVNFIEESIKAILNQQLSFEWELIIGDDESTDGTREICVKYAKLYPNRIRLFLHSQKNVIKVHNQSCGIFQIAYNLLKARGKYIAMCSGDDIWGDSMKLQKQLNLISSNNNISLCFQAWIEKYHSYDGRISYGAINTYYPKASTILYRNINQILPIQFLNVIQEDEFLYFILRGIGDFIITPNLEPVIINTPLNSITRSLNSNLKKLHVLNLKENLFLAFYNTPFKWLVIKHLLSSYKDIVRQISLKTFASDFKLVISSIFRIIIKILATR
jgi:glycosyltransferase involved in cell wall biosynthesis